MISLSPPPLSLLFKYTRAFSHSLSRTRTHTFSLVAMEQIPKVFNNQTYININMHTHTRIYIYLLSCDNGHNHLPDLRLQQSPTFLSFSRGVPGKFVVWAHHSSTTIPTLCMVVLLSLFLSVTFSLTPFFLFLFFHFHLCFSFCISTKRAYISCYTGRKFINPPG